MSPSPAQGTISEEQIARILDQVGRREEPPLAAREAIRAAAHAAWREGLESRRQTRRRWVFLAAAASFLLIVGVAFQVQNTPPQTGPVWATITEQVNGMEYRDGDGGWESLPPGASVNVPVGYSLRTASESYSALETRDGLGIRLDANTEVQILGPGEVFLHTGGVYVDAAGPAQLTVRTPAGSARDIGTRFEVRVVPGGWQVQVRDGQVVIDDAGNGSLVADAGERLRLPIGAAPQREPVSPADSSWAWTHVVATPMQIENATLEEYLSWWSAESGVQVAFDTPQSEAVSTESRLHGSIESLSLQDGFDAVLASSGYRVVDLSESTIILAR